MAPGPRCRSDGHLGARLFFWRGRLLVFAADEESTDLGYGVGKIGPIFLEHHLFHHEFWPEEVEASICLAPFFDNQIWIVSFVHGETSFLLMDCEVTPGVSEDVTAFNDLVIHHCAGKGRRQHEIR